ncbi:MAG: hypothetical protein FJ299_03400 [Planctomycetes bacterium]|nr:hypothetical protein [Planctomycetota bacterium]
MLMPSVLIAPMAAHVESGSGREASVEELRRISRIELARILCCFAAQQDAGPVAIRTSVRWPQLRAALSEHPQALLRRAERLLALLDELEGCAESESGASEAPHPGDGRAWLRRAIAAVRAGSSPPLPAGREAALWILLSADCVEGRLLLAGRQLEEGAARAALETSRSLLQHDSPAWPALLRQQAWRALADAHEACGNDRLALAACQAAIRSRDRGPWPAQCGLVLSLATADVGRARLFARALARCDRTEWSSDLSRLRARVAHWRGPLPWRPSFNWRRALDGGPRNEDRADPGPAAEVCAALS